MLTFVLDELRAHLRTQGVPLPRVLTGPARAVHLCSRWKGRAVYVIFGIRERTPSLVLKVDSESDHQPRLRAEYEALTQHATAEMRGRIPAPIALFTAGSCLALAESALPGVPLSVLLRRRIRSSARKSARDHAMVFDCLAALHASAPPLPPVPFDAKRAVQQMATALPDGGETCGPFLQAMSADAERFAGLPIPMLPGHGDIGPSNCLVSGSSVGLTDWEGGVGQREPLTEIVVFLSHYARALPVQRHRMPRRSEAFLRAFVGDGWLAQLTADSFTTQLRRLDLPSAAAPLLLASALARLATGEAPTAHGRRPGSRRNWSELLALYARNVHDSPLDRPGRSPGGSRRGLARGTEFG